MKLPWLALLFAVACEGGQAAPSRAPAPAPSPQPRPEKPSAQPSAARPPAPASGSPWASPERCEALVRTGQRLAKPANQVRVASWNIRWFPDGKPGKRPAPDGTDIAWLACAMAYVDADAWALQEIKATTHARARMTELLAALARHTGAPHRVALDPCGPTHQHVGVLWNASRVRAGEPKLLAGINPHGEACKDQLRPGLALYLKMAGGLDLHLVSVHLKSGTKRRDVDLRKRSIASLGSALSELVAASDDGDVIVAGDFNTMGCSKCSPGISAQDELSALDRALAELTRPARRVPSRQGCTQSHGRSGGLLDHFVLADLAELPARAQSVAQGPCAELDCRFPARPTRADQALSDHCPVILDLPARDRD